MSQIELTITRDDSTEPAGYRRLARTHLRKPRNGLALTVCQSGGLMRVFTGDTLG
jgi:hypothetical protein